MRSGMFEGGPTFSAHGVDTDCGYVRSSHKPDVHRSLHEGPSRSSPARGFRLLERADIPLVEGFHDLSAPKERRERQPPRGAESQHRTFTGAH